MMKLHGGHEIFSLLPDLIHVYIQRGWWNFFFQINWFFIIKGLEWYRCIWHTHTTKIQKIFSLIGLFHYVCIVHVFLVLLTLDQYWWKFMLQWKDDSKPNYMHNSVLNFSSIPTPTENHIYTFKIIF